MDVNDDKTDPLDFQPVAELQHTSSGCDEAVSQQPGDSIVGDRVSDGAELNRKSLAISVSREGRVNNTEGVADEDATFGIGNGDVGKDLPKQVESGLIMEAGKRKASMGGPSNLSARVSTLANGRFLHWTDSSGTIAGDTASSRAKSDSLGNNVYVTMTSTEDLFSEMPSATLTMQTHSADCSDSRSLNAENVVVGEGNASCNGVTEKSSGNDRCENLCSESENEGSKQPPGTGKGTVQFEDQSTVPAGERDFNFSTCKATHDAGYIDAPIALLGEGVLSTDTDSVVSAQNQRVCSKNEAESISINLAELTHHNDSQQRN